MDAKEPRYANAENTLIDLTLMHPVFGEIPFTADPQDVEAHGRDLFARAVAGEFGPVAEYVPPLEAAEVPLQADQANPE